MEKKKIGLNKCLAECAKLGTKCSAVEFYAKGWKKTDCFLMLDSKNKGIKASKGSPRKKRFRDATCYV
jgi:hypothetical protein